MRWLSSLRALGNRDALHPEYTNTFKKTASRLRKCLRGDERAPAARSSATHRHVRAAMQKVQQRPASTFVNIAGNACAADVFTIHDRHHRRAIDVIATHSHRLKAACVDSESQTLAIKKFSWSQRWRLIGARQNRFFGRIAAADSLAAFPS